MAKNITNETINDVLDFLNTVTNEKQKQDCLKLSEFLSQSTGYEAKMWGSAIAGYGKYSYKYDSGHSGEAPRIGFAPRASSIALYISSNFKDREELLSKLGKHKSQKACIHIKSLEDVDLQILDKIVENQLSHMQMNYPTT